MSNINNQLLRDWLTRWSLNKSEGSHILGIQKSKMSEYTNDQLKLPPYIRNHIENFNELSKAKGQSLIKRKLEEI